MDGLITVESIKVGVTLVTALGKLVEAAKKSKNPNLQDVFQKLRGEAINLGRAIEHNLDEITRELKEQGIDLRKSLVDADHQ